MRNPLASDRARARSSHMLFKGQSIDSIERIIGVSKNTVAKLLSDAGMCVLNIGLTRLTGGLSKQIYQHASPVALHFV